MKHTVDGYTGIMNSLSVETANRPTEVLALSAELAAAEGSLAAAEDLLLSLLFFVPTTAPTTTATITIMATGTPNLIQGLRPFFGF